MTFCQGCFGSNSLTVSLIMFLKEFFEKLILKKSEDDNKSMKNYPACKELRYPNIYEWLDKFEPWHVISNNVAF